MLGPTIVAGGFALGGVMVGAGGQFLLAGIARRQAREDRRMQREREADVWQQEVLMELQDTLGDFYMALVEAEVEKKRRLAKFGVWPVAAGDLTDDVRRRASNAFSKANVLVSRVLSDEARASADKAIDHLLQQLVAKTETEANKAGDDLVIALTEAQNSLGAAIRGLAAPNPGGGAPVASQR